MVRRRKITKEFVLWEANHVFLPPKLPQEDDSDTDLERLLAYDVLMALEDFKAYYPDNLNLANATRMIENMVTARQTKSGELLNNVVLRSLENLAGSDSLIFHLRAQNAGLLITRLGDGVRFSCFELLASNKEVMSCSGRLVRTFPGPCVTVSSDIVLNPDFCHPFVDTLFTLDVEIDPQSRPQTKKAGVNVAEERDTIHPRLATDMLMGLLRGVGEESTFQRLEKHSREDVLWHNAKISWHRSAQWQNLRVALQLVLNNDKSLDAHDSLYKEFMVFFHAHVLESGLGHSLPSDLLYIMSTKISRRLVKLGPGDDTPWLPCVAGLLQTAKAKLEERWGNIQKDSHNPASLKAFTTLNFGEDAYLELASLKEHLAWIETPRNVPAMPIGSAPPTVNSLQLASNELPKCGFKKQPSSLPYELIDFERWVEKHLSTWLQLNAQHKYTCGRLAKLIETYYEAASEAYQANPESLAIMYLTIMELWVACDQSATRLHPLLLDYHTGFRPTFLDPLVLRKLEHIRRLMSIEDYLACRDSRALPQSPSVFDGYGNKRSLGARFYESSEDHKALLRRIREDAKDARERLEKELEQKKQHHKRLLDTHRTTSHQQYQKQDSHGHLEPACLATCQKCKALQDANSLQINVHEWPLPDDDTEAKNVVFELNVPEAIAAWRTITMLLLVDIFSDTEETIANTRAPPPRLWKALDFQGLQTYLRRNGLKNRLQLISVSKPFTAAHYRSVKVAEATTHSIYVRHGSRYHYYDSTYSRKAAVMIQRTITPAHCSYAACSDFEFRDWIIDWSHTSNEVLAAQSKCPINKMSLEEFRSFGHIRAGVCLQWQNILSQLMIPSLDLNSFDTCLLFLQAVCEVGPRTHRNSGHPTTSGRFLLGRVAHEVLYDHDFAASFLSGLQRALETIAANWESDVSLFTLLSLCLRVATQAVDPDVIATCLTFTSQIRLVSTRWVNALLEKLFKSTDSSEREDLSLRIFTMALICHCTFDVGPSHLPIVLGIDDAATQLIVCSIIIKQYMPPEGVKPTKLCAFLLGRWQRLSCELAPYLTSALLKDSSNLDTAIQRFWAGYQPSRTWALTAKRYDHVLSSTIDSRNGGKAMEVTYNALDGTLLIQGRPLSRLPQTYQDHSSFRQLFGSNILEVMPASPDNMEFSSTRLQGGCAVHLAMFGKRLVIRTTRQNETWEFIPATALAGDFPSEFVQKYCHWWDVNRRILEFRPLNDPWTASDDNWIMSGSGSISRPVLRKGKWKLVDVHSRTAKLFADVLGRIEAPDGIHITLDSDTATLDIELSRLHLSFSLKKGSDIIASKNYHGMYVDESQAIGSLVGLRSKLVLRSSNGPTEANTRAVIIPHGIFGVNLDARGHPIVSITSNGQVAAKHHYLTIDTLLGRLVDNGSLQSKLVLSYLHAITTFCIPDALTGRTGSEESIRILSSAAVLSFQRLSDAEVQLLNQIASLTPRRDWYPLVKRVQQEVKFNPMLSQLAQRDDFFLLVRDILDHAQRCDMFYPEAKTLSTPVTRGNDFLLNRAYLRNAAFHSSVGRTARSLHRLDSRCHGRDDGAFAALEVSIQRISSYLASESTGSLDPITIDIAKEVLKMLGKGTAGARNDQDDSTSTLEPAFDMQWLRQPSTNFAQNWTDIQRALSSTVLSQSKYSLIFFFAALVFADRSDLQIIQFLLGFATIPKMRSLEPPGCAKHFSLSEGSTSNRPSIRRLVERHQLPLKGKTRTKKRKAAMRAWDNRVQDATERFITAIFSQNPSSFVAPRGPDFRECLSVDKIMEALPKLSAQWNHNRLFEEYLELAVAEFTSAMPASVPVVVCGLRSCSSHQSRTCRVGIKNVFSQAAPQISLLPARSFSEFRLAVPRATTEKQCSRLVEVLNKVAHRNQPEFEQRYLRELSDSIDSLENNGERDNTIQVQGGATDIQAAVVENFQATTRQLNVIQRRIECCLKRGSHYLQVAQSGPNGPKLDPISLLQRLNRHHWAGINTGWKECIVQYALALTHVQRAERLVAALHNARDLAREMVNIGHCWDPMKFPESLLLEVESGLIIRDVQEKVASTMRSPPEDKNSVLQLNMGEGKSSVIVEIVAAHLADGKRLVRVLVAKPQSKQMHHMLVTKLGGLLDRRVMYMPFSRSLKLTPEDLHAAQVMFNTCKQSGGVLLCQPEHLLSFKLMGIENVYAAYGSQLEARKEIPEVRDRGRLDAGRQVLELQRFCDTYSRDIVDESDENFSVKFELIYTMGTQQPTEMSPERWLLIHRVLDLVAQIGLDVNVALPGSLLVESKHSGGFPMTRIVKREGGIILFNEVARIICKDGLPGLPISRQDPAFRQAVWKYITMPQPPAADMSVVEEASDFFTGLTKQSLLLLRGLFAGNIMVFALEKKRWRVNYGRASREPPTMLAVPYRAKDSPAPRSEFSHPDIVIILTSLTYYYAGLTDDEMFIAFDYLFKCDQNEIEYSEWATASPLLPSAFRHISGINIKDAELCRKKIFPFLCFIKPVIDFYLSRAVFPKEMRGFPSKLSASGWDLAISKPNPTTGFSGTCDSKYILPLNIEHLDLPEQSHTNAHVLSCLLRPENRVKVLEYEEASSQISADCLINSVSDPERPCQVILDVGALVLDLDNEQFAKRWLERTPFTDMQAVVFFDENDELCVVDRAGRVERLVTSPFSRRMDSCLVFLDEAHTRGTDLKLPEDYRAATTLGAHLTKDRLVQACMRMRKLGEGQSVIFYVPPEVSDKIREFRNLSPESAVGVADVLAWTIRETWIDAAQSIQLWAIQGLRHQRQEVIWGKAVPRVGPILATKDDFEDYLEGEALTLETRYLPRRATSSQSIANELHHSRLAGRQAEVKKIADRCNSFQVATLNGAGLHEEQERELAPEIEQERHVEKAPPAVPEKHYISDQLIRFFQTGQLDRRYNGFLSAFTSLSSTACEGLIRLEDFGDDLLVSKDFATTVVVPGRTSSADFFQRPVQWVVTSPQDEADKRPRYMVLISPFEANYLLSDRLRKISVTLHLYAPRPSLAMPSLEDLTLYTFPKLVTDCEVSRLLVLQLNLFAGQLYFRSQAEYAELCTFLGLSFAPNDGKGTLAADGFIGRRGYQVCRFSKSPAECLRVLISRIRRDRQTISKTHIGRLLAGELLVERDFQVDMGSRVVEVEDGADDIMVDARQIAVPATRPGPAAVPIAVPLVVPGTVDAPILIEEDEPTVIVIEDDDEQHLMDIDG